MEAWARQYPMVQFLCICVESHRVAAMFAKWFDFDKVINGFIPSRNYVPHGYGQLGCSGFVVSDENGYFVSRKTKAFLQYERGAFRDVERILANLVDLRQSPVTTDSTGSTSDNTSSSTQEEEAVLSSITSPTSVNDAEMDHEHEDCTTAINKYLSTLTKNDLIEVYKTLGSHFAHEEEMLETHHNPRFGAANKEFSALESHKKDHQRILNMCLTEVERLGC